LEIVVPSSKTLH